MGRGGGDGRCCDGRSEIEQRLNSMNRSTVIAISDVS